VDSRKTSDGIGDTKSLRGERTLGATEYLSEKQAKWYAGLEKTLSGGGRGKKGGRRTS